MFTYFFAHERTRTRVIVLRSPVQVNVNGRSGIWLYMQDKTISITRKNKNRRFSFSVSIRTLSNICRARHCKQQKTHMYIRTHTDTRTSVHLSRTQEILNKITSGKSLKHPALYLSLLVLANVWRFYCCAKKFALFFLSMISHDLTNIIIISGV